MQPTALHWTSTLGDCICLINGGRPPRFTISALFSAAQLLASIHNGFQRRRKNDRTVHGKVAERCARGSLNFDVGTLEQREDGLEGVSIDLSHICHSNEVNISYQLACDRKHKPCSVISAKVKLALRCKSILFDSTNVVRARSGSPEKKSKSVSKSFSSRYGAIVSIIIPLLKTCA